MNRPCTYVLRLPLYRCAAPPPPPPRLYRRRCRYAAIDVGVLLYHLETHPGIVVLITNQPAAIDKAFHRRIRFMLGFKVRGARVGGGVGGR